MTTYSSSLVIIGYVRCNNATHPSLWQYLQHSGRIVTDVQLYIDVLRSRQQLNVVKGHVLDVSHIGEAAPPGFVVIYKIL
jgi:hypothetical protein